MNDVLKIIIKRLGLGLLTLLAVSIIIFGAIELRPGGVAEAVLGQGATAENVAAYEKELGLDRPAPVRYFEWLGGALTGDFGKSMTNGRQVSELIAPRFANTLFLALYAAAVAVPLALFLGIMAALYRNSIFDRIVNVMTLTSISSPEFFVGYILILFFAIKNSYFPALSNVNDEMDIIDRLYRLFLPAMTMVLVVTAHMMRMTRASIISLLASPYIEMARLKGVPQSRVITRHALPNALAPIINVIALNLAYLVTGVVLVEVVFVYPGIGQLLVDSVTKQDYPVILACTLTFATVYILLNLAADVGAILSNPRLRHPK